MINLRSLLALTLSLVYVIADNKKCPTYSCQKGSGNTCAVATVATSAYNDVVLFPSCNTTQYCNVVGTAYDTLAQLTQSTNYTCADATNATTLNRYPGEDCSADKDCIKVTGDNSTGTCTANKTCSGTTESANCTSTTVCLKGLYCDANGTCKKQKSANATCVSSYECINSLLCHTGTCSIAPFSLDVGTTISSTDTLSLEKCNFGLTALKNISDPTSLACTTKVQSVNGDKNGFVSCDHGDTCYYDDPVANTTLSQECVCGYNADGKGWCPVGYNKRSDKYTNLYTKKAASFSADCHTLSRAACYKLDDDKKKEITSLGRALQNEHVYYGAVDCAAVVFGAGSFASFSMMMFLLLVSLLA
jgi:hypothetical protein